MFALCPMLWGLIGGYMALFTSGYYRRFIPLGFVLLALLAFFVLGGPRYISLEALREHRHGLQQLVQDHPVMTLLGMVATYAFLVAISFPAASLLSIFSGFLFGTWLGGAVNVTGATTGATLVFFIARTAMGNTLERRAGPSLEKFRAGFAANAFSYLLTLRLIPVFPFWLVNIAPAFFPVSLRTFIGATVLGIIPGALVYASVGAGAGVALETGQELPLKGLLLKPEILGPIMALALLSLLPVVIKALRKGKTNG